VSALCLGVASHLVLDAIPHGDSGIGHWVHSPPNHVTKLQRLLPIVFVDQILAAGVFFLLLSSPLLTSTAFWTLFAGAFGSILPDYLTGFRDLLPKPPRWLESIHRFHEKCHYRGHDPLSIRGGLVLQTLLTLAAICASYIF